MENWEEVYSVDDLFRTIPNNPSMLTFHLDEIELIDLDKIYLDYIKNQQVETRFIFESKKHRFHSENIVSAWLSAN
jgi:hypothetical protein